MEDYISGELLRFWALSGQFRAGQEERRLRAGYRLIADMPSLRVGFMRWSPGYEEQRVERAAMVFVRDGSLPPKRESLGDVDPTQWAYPDRDPWQCVSLLGMIHPETKRRYTYLAVTAAENGAIAEVCTLYGRYASMPGCEAALPIIRLKTTRNGGVHCPRFLIDGWAERGTVAA
jgi:hypothetical protein